MIPIVTEKKIDIKKIFFGIILSVFVIILDPIIRKNTLVVDDTINTVFQYITRMGDALIGIPLVTLVMVFAYYKNKLSHNYGLQNHIVKGFLKTIIIMCIGTVVINVGKSIIGRARPKLFSEFGAYHFEPFNFGLGYDYTSFPSGHTTTWGLLALSMAIIFPRYKMLWIFSAIMVGLSRVILGSHYISDVFFSLLLSYAIVYYCHYDTKVNDMIDILKKKITL